MDLSEGEGEEADAVYQQEDINEDDLLGSDEDEETSQNKFHGSYSEECETNQEHEDEYEDVLDLELGEDVDELELVPESLSESRVRVAPVKVRPAIVQEKKTDAVDSTSGADQVNEIGSQTHSLCDSSASATVTEDLDNDCPEETKVQRTRFVTERPALGGSETGDRSNNFVGNPIQTLGQRNGRNFPRQPTPRIRTNQMRQMGPRHHSNQNVVPQPQNRPFFPNRHRLPRGMVRGQEPRFNPPPGHQGLIRPGLPRDQPILQFPGQIFTDFTKPMLGSPVHMMPQNPQLGQNVRPDAFLQQRLPAPMPDLQAPNGHSVLQNHSGQENRSAQQNNMTSIQQSSPQESRGANNTLGRAELHIAPLINSGANFPPVQGPNFQNEGNGFRPHHNSNFNLPAHNIQNAGIGSTGPRVPGMFRPQLQSGMAPGMAIMRQPPTRFPQQLFNNQPRAPVNVHMQFQGPGPEIGIGNTHFQQIRLTGAPADNLYWRGPHHQDRPFFVPPDNSNFYPHGNLDFGGYRPPIFPPNGWNVPSHQTNQHGPSNGQMFPPGFGEFHPMYQDPLYNYQPMHTLPQPNMNMVPQTHGSRDIAHELMFPSHSNLTNPNNSYGMKMQQRPLINEIEAEFDKRKYSERDHYRRDDTRKFSSGSDNEQFGKRKSEYDTRSQEIPEKKVHARLGPPVSSSRGDSKEDQIVKIIMETKKEMGIDDKYLQQIEDQKNKRAEVMRLKEERRRLAAVNSEGLKLKNGRETTASDEKRSKPDTKVESSSTMKYSDRPLQPGQQIPLSQSIHINPLAFKGDLSLLNANLKKINMNVSNASGSTASTAGRQPSSSQVRVRTASDEPKQQVSDNSERPRKILRIVKNKNGEVIRKSKVIIMRKPNQDSNQD